MADGNRYMGICGSKAMSSMVDGDECLMWPVPESWSLEDAATVPVVYATVTYSLLRSLLWVDCALNGEFDTSHLGSVAC